MQLNITTRPKASNNPLKLPEPSNDSRNFSIFPRTFQFICIAFEAAIYSRKKHPQLSFEQAKGTLPAASDIASQISITQHRRKECWSMKHRPHHRHKFLPRDSFVDDILSFLVSSPFFFAVCLFIPVVLVQSQRRIFGGWEDSQRKHEGKGEAEKMLIQLSTWYKTFPLVLIQFRNARLFAAFNYFNVTDGGYEGEWNVPREEAKLVPQFAESITALQLIIYIHCCTHCCGQVWRSL